MRICTGLYPVGASPQTRWEPPPEKLKEAKELVGLDNEQKARVRAASVWREIDKSCVVGDTRYFVSLKSGPQTINDTQAAAMQSAIADKYRDWWRETKRRYKGVTQLDIVIGLTYGTNRSTVNKEKRILVKLLERGFEVEDQDEASGIIVDGATQSVRVYRQIGIDFWAFIGRSDKPSKTQHILLEILIALSKALNELDAKKGVEDAVSEKIDKLVKALVKMKPSKGSLPDWLTEDYSETELSWLMGAMSAFFDGGI